MHDMEKPDITQVIQKPSLKIRRKYYGVPQLRLFVHIYVESTQSVRPPDGSVIIRTPPSNFSSQLQVDTTTRYASKSMQWIPQLRLFVHIYVESTQSVRPPDGSVIIRIPQIPIFYSRHSSRIKQRGIRRKACRPLSKDCLYTFTSNQHRVSDRPTEMSSLGSPHTDIFQSTFNL
jgi:hypothetical protein